MVYMLMVKDFFLFLGIVGDNLGLHQLMNFVESFSSNFPCRMCKVNSRDL